MAVAPRYGRWRNWWRTGSLRTVRWLAIVCVLGSLCPHAHALDLAWSAPEDCLSATEISARVAALHARYEQTDPGAVARVQIEREPSGDFTLKLDVEVRGQRLSRVVRSRDCLSACETAAWLLAMAGVQDERPVAATGAKPAARAAAARALEKGRSSLERPAPGSEPVAAGQRTGSTSSTGSTAMNGAVLAQPERPADGERPSETGGSSEPGPEPGPAHEPARTAVEAPAPPEPVSARQEPKRANPPRWGRLALFAGLWGNNLPAPGAMLGARAGMGRGIFYGEVRGAFVLPREEQLAGQGHVRVYTQQLGLAGCAQWGGRLRGGPCLQLTGQHSVGTTTAGVRTRQDDVFWLTGGPSALLGVALYEALELSLEAGVGLPLSARPRFSVQGGRSLVSADFVSGYALVGLGVRWR